MSVFVPIIMGSKSDLDHGRAIQKALEVLGVPSEIRVASAHKHPHYLIEILKAYEGDPRPKCYVTIAGRSNALSALICGQINSPVIACPPVSSTFGGNDIFSSLRMPSGVAPMVVLGAGNAALAAVKVLTLAEPSLRDTVAGVHEANRQRIAADDAETRG